LSIYDEQLKKRIENDNQAMEDAYVEFDALVTGKWTKKRVGKRSTTSEVIDRILEYYKILERRTIVDYQDDIEGQLESRIENNGIFYRKVKLTKSWYKHSTGPIVAKFADDGEYVALIPNSFSGYYYQESGTSKKIKINKSNENLFDKDALCFYRPLPMERMDFKDLVKYVFGLLSAADIAFVIITLLVTMALDVIVPLLNRQIFSEVIDTGSIRLLIGVVTFLLCSSLSATFVRIINSLVNNRIMGKVDITVESAMMMRILSMPTTFFQNYSSGELSQKLQYVNELCSVLISTILNEALYFLFSLIFLVQIAVMSPAMTIPALLMIVFMMILSFAIVAIRSSEITKLSKVEAENYALTYSYITGIEQITLAGAEKRAFARWAHRYAKEVGLTYSPSLFANVYGVIGMGIGLIANVAFFYVAASKGLSTADYFAFESAYGLLCGGIAGMVGISDNIAVIRSMKKVIMPFLETAPEVSDVKQPITDLKGAINIDHVSFKYSEDGPQVIDNLTLNIKAREYVAIVGTTGCGKSTLLRLLLGFENPQKGTIYYDRKPLNSLNVKSVRRRIGTVLQNGRLIQESIFENIVLSHPELTMDDAWEAAKVAGLDDVIKEMPMGMNTLISEGSGGISGGQRQRILIARAVAAKPRILFFDEATSALDNVTQKKVSDAIDNLNCTRIIIAHRLSTIKNCDRIIVLDKGRIAEEGKYDELIERDGLFKKLVERQMLDKK